jgi:hypothetical protein
MTGAGKRPDEPFGDDFIDGVFDGVFVALPKLVSTLRLGSGGYTLLIGAPPGQVSPQPCMHVVGGGMPT